ncbi:non-hydrolyzing UDP-N-acetylglucosamine 2-epimerase [Lutimonas zeaxanthinifaciens]|uniref:non-hydrolyzing UDP-N-acetylglucosamine 2-epimerase n=1 Tax=Lutimonas zeaxanthinifaciens TaxID=3060215 RepID=UPI00265D3C23|nr:UDP-N-acetylglucosamine 2-epimerase (non-hydrolyzing) [Lutimonas sp. YSD2104]WKK67360.1 UDP-N-acetylglucosamine 2-epimerase (non-hydrolyzing) [Lutimonas sp. YSD2104]
MKKVLTVFGTRPEGIKMAVLAKELNEEKYIDHKICVTAQHRDMLDQVLELFDITPDFDLDIMQHGQDLTDVTNRVLSGMRDLFKNTWKPDLVLIHGDTTTCFATALAAFYAGIKIGHVEAGLRTGDLRSPFPEEANRVLVSRIATYHFAPTVKNVENLLDEGVMEERIIQTGNTVIDSLKFIAHKLEGFSEKIRNTGLPDLLENGRKFILITGHRRENFGDGFIHICAAIKELAITNNTFDFVYPVHMNPNVQKPVREILAELPNVHLIKPLQYEDFVYAMKHSYLVLTDSGGVQEEAPGLGKPVLVMRDTTERPEAVEAGTVRLVGADKGNIVSGVQNLIDDQELYDQMSEAHNPYGEGDSVRKIVKFILEL